MTKPARPSRTRSSTEVWSYDAEGQGRDAGTMLDLLLQGGATPDNSMLKIESPLKIIEARAELQ